MQDEYELFELYIDFTKSEGDPTRVFKTMAGLIEGMQSIDKHLAQSLNISVNTNLVLEEIQSGSIKAKFRSVIEEIPDTALKNGEIKPIIGHFLHKGKHKILQWCSERDKIENREEVKKLQNEILELAEETDLTHIPAYIPLNEEALLTDINSIQESLLYLEKTDSAKLISNQVESTFNKDLNISSEVVKEMITREVIISENTKILKVKKPDYLGSSKWSFKHEGHTIEAKMLNKEWLVQYQNRLIELHPGDSIKVVLVEETSYGYDNEVVHIDYSVKEVKEILPAQKIIRPRLLE
ncbi:MAG: hypothetical protein AB7D34_05615 [Sulfurimonas sp.]